MSSTSKKPCAYCGKSDSPRHHGHVIPKSLYPAATPNRIQRPTVAECETCKTIWTDAETHFRNVLIIAGDPNEAVKEKWQTVCRSFDKPSGKRWVSELFQSMDPIDTDTGPRHVVFPYKDPRVNLVLRKIIRGLNAFHGLGEAIPDTNAWVGYAPKELPPSARERFLRYSLGDEFVRYGFEQFDDDRLISSGWLIRFYGQRDFIGVISKQADAKEIFSQRFNP